MDASYFEVLPKVVPADAESEIRIRPLFGNARFPGLDAIAVEYIPADGPAAVQEPVRRVTMEEGVLAIRVRCEGEQQHLLRVTLKEVPGSPLLPWARLENLTLDFKIYSLAADLYGLAALKGDLHCHTRCSDGSETPEYTACRYRERGFDFMAVTDHNDHEASLEAIAAWRDLELGFGIFPGEEVHLPVGEGEAHGLAHIYRHAHMVNFGGQGSVSVPAHGDPAAFFAEVDRRAAQVDASLSPRDRFLVASAEWAAERIRECGGVAILAHPFWHQQDQVLPQRAAEALFQRGNFDAWEVWGGSTRNGWRDNNLALAWYSHLAGQGRQYPAVGASDSHGARFDGIGWYYTVVLAASEEFADIAEAIRAGRCVAVQDVPGGVPNAVGDFRLVKYVTFLLNEYFPAHGRLCRPEGELMFEALAGSAGARELLRARGRTAPRFRDAFFGRARP